MDGERMPEAQDQVKELARLKKRITELETENHRLRQGQEMISLQPSYEMLLHALPVGLILLDSQGAILQFNDAARRLLQLKEPPIHQQPFADALQGHPLQDALIGSLTGEQPTAELQLACGSNPAPPTTLKLQTTRLRNRRGRLVGTALLLSDLTLLREQGRLQTEALHMAGHELRCPLTTMIGFTELLLSQPGLGIDQQQQFLNYILEKAQLMTHIVADLQQVARIEEKQPLLLRQLLCDLRDVIRKAVEETEWHHPNHRFTVDLPAAPLLAMVDPGRITQVLTNLLSNAVKYSPKGGTIRIQAAATPRKAMRITVSDEGDGIPVAEAGRVFDRYYRSEAHRNQVRGLGLGLTISQSIVLAHGGEIWLKSRPGSGTSVCFTLPGTSDELRRLPVGSPRQDLGLAGLAALNG